MKALALFLVPALLLLGSRPATADNYTSRSSRIVEAAHPELIEEEGPASQPPDSEPPAAEPVPAEPVKAPEPVPAPAPVAAAPVVPVVPAQPPTPPKPEKVWLDGKLPAEAQTEGEWIWASDPTAGPVFTHSHPAAKGIQNHRFTSAGSIEMPGNGMLVQQVWLDPQDPPQGIALRFRIDSGEEVGVYWEGEKEVFTPSEYEELWYYGTLPELGKWVSLEVLAEDLGLEDGRIAGITFSTFDGRVLWGKTTITEAPPLEGDGTEQSPEPIIDTKVTK